MATKALAFPRIPRFLNANVGIPTIGPLNGNATPSGRLLQSVVPYGIVGTPYFNASFASMFTANNSGIALIPGSSTINLGSLLAGDIVELSAPAMSSNTTAYLLAAYVSENGGAYFPALGAAQTYAATVGGAYASTPMSFIRTVGASGVYTIQFWGAVGGSATMSVTCPVIYARTFRP